MTAADKTGFPSTRRRSRRIELGGVVVGGDAAISVQTMTKTDTRDVAATARQIRECVTAGAEIVRLAVPDEAAAKALKAIVEAVEVPLVADIHFDHRLALLSLEAGVAGLRINPGNIGGRARVEEVVAAARDRKVPIRIGVNSGSLEKDILERYGEASAEALVESALRHVAILETLGYGEIKISVKASGVIRTVEAYRLLAAKVDYPLHLGVTEAGTFLAGTVRSSVGLGVLLAEGIGDTIRISLTDHPVREVMVGLELLRALGLREPGPSVISCPTCGRTEVNVAAIAHAVEARLDEWYREQPGAPRPCVAVMGCMVNGPGEAREADIALAGGREKFGLFVNGVPSGTFREQEAVDALMREVRGWKSRGRSG